jgi:hypothetical protein
MISCAAGGMTAVGVGCSDLFGREGVRCISNLMFAQEDVDSRCEKTAFVGSQGRVQDVWYSGQLDIED